MGTSLATQRDRDRTRESDLESRTRARASAECAQVSVQSSNACKSVILTALVSRFRAIGTSARFAVHALGFDYFVHARGTAIGTCGFRFVIDACGAAPVFSPGWVFRAGITPIGASGASLEVAHRISAFGRSRFDLESPLRAASAAACRHKGRETSTNSANSA